MTTSGPATVPSLTLSNGVEIPQLGYGVFQVPAESTHEYVATAFDAGYRHIDTAAGYGNEAGVGKAIAASGLRRDEIFVTTKLSNGDQGFEKTLAAFETSRSKLGLEVVDLYLIHFPAPGRGLFQQSWNALEALYAEGSIRAIGVSNFKGPYLGRLLETADIVPMVHQIEVHPSYQQQELSARSRELGMVIEAYSPLGRGIDINAPAVIEAAFSHGVSAAQVILRWHIQQGRVVIPKSVKEPRIRQNADIASFTLDDVDMAAISALESGQMTGEDIETFN
jgi:diketogulonate reductase-like aldo/keto reductase